MANPLSIRAGVWRDPRHTMRFEGQPDPNDAYAVLFSALFSTGDDEIHYSAGLGMAFESFQIDAAIDISDRVDTFSLSGVVRF